MSVHPAKLDHVADLLVRVAPPAAATAARGNALNGGRNASSSHPATADHVNAILHSVPPDRLKDREAFGINSINHKRYLEQKQAELTPALRLSAEADRFYNGIAEAKANRPSSLATRAMLYDSAAVSSALRTERPSFSSASSSAAAQPSSSPSKPVVTTFDVHDAVRTPTGLILPEPSPNHRGAGRAAAKMREDHLRATAEGLTTVESAREAGSAHAAGVPGAPLSTSTTARPDRARVVADQYGAQARDLMIHTRPSTSSSSAASGGNPLAYAGRPAVAAGRERFWKGEGVATAIARPAGMDPDPVVGHAVPAAVGSRPVTRGGRDDDDGDRRGGGAFRTTYMAQADGEVTVSPPRRRYYGGAHGSASLDPNKRTSIY